MHTQVSHLAQECIGAGGEGLTGGGPQELAESWAVRVWCSQVEWIENSSQAACAEEREQRKVEAGPGPAPLLGQEVRYYPFYVKLWAIICLE